MQLATVNEKPILFNGGYDAVTPPLQLDPSYARAIVNFEQDLNGGYTRTKGYERFDGHDPPSNAVPTQLTYTYGALAAPSAGKWIIGGTSGAKGVVYGYTGGIVYYYAVTGTFVNGEAISVKNASFGPVIGAGTAASSPSVSAFSSSINSAVAYAAAADAARSIIGSVPGSGSVLGVWIYNDVIYAFRNDAGGTTAAMFKSSSVGWTQITFGEEVGFSNANTSVNDGDTLTQGGVTATVARVVLQTGSLESGVNTGRLIITGRGGGNFAAGAATSTGGGTLTLAGIQTAITLAPSGKFEFVNHSFTGGSSMRMYGCDGKNRAFEFDGTTFVPISTGMTIVSDTPSHIAAHRGHLFLSFGNSVQHSRPGFPYQWSVIVGAGEIAMGDTVTAFLQQPGGQGEAALTIFTRNHTSTLYGSGIINWQLVPFRGNSGAYPYTAEFIAFGIYLDDRGVVNLSAAQEYGNFENATMTKRVQPWVLARKGLSVKSVTIRQKNQYRLLFSSGECLVITFENTKVLGMTTLQYAFTPTCATSDEMADGTERVFVGAADGYVYELEKGTSFDGASYDSYFDMAWCNFGSPRVDKRFRHVTFEVDGSGYSQFAFTYELGYGMPEVTQPGLQTLDASTTPQFWDSGINWDQGFVWDGRKLSPLRGDLGGSGENLSIKVKMSSKIASPLRFSGVLVQFSQRRRLR